MAYAINIRADNGTARHIEKLWRLASFFEASPSMEVMNYPPHITVAVYDEIEEEVLFEALRAGFEGIPKLPIRIVGLGFFEPANSIVLWAAPEVPQLLRSAVQTIHDYVGLARCRPSYRPGRWVPHCTLALRVSRENRDKAIAFVKASIDPFEVVFDVADCASFHPITVLQECNLA
jgi:2'-5' RNA ligase